MPTPNYNLPTINRSHTADVPRDLNTLAEAVDVAIKQAVNGVDLSGVTQQITNLNNELDEYKSDVDALKIEVNGARTRLINLANSVVDSII